MVRWLSAEAAIRKRCAVPPPNPMLRNIKRVLAHNSILHFSELFKQFKIIAPMWSCYSNKSKKAWNYIGYFNVCSQKYARAFTLPMLFFAALSLCYVIVISQKALVYACLAKTAKLAHLDFLFGSFKSNKHLFWDWLPPRSSSSPMHCTNIFNS